MLLLGYSHGSFISITNFQMNYVINLLFFLILVIFRVLFWNDISILLNISYVMGVLIGMLINIQEESKLNIFSMAQSFLTIIITQISFLDFTKFFTYSIIKIENSLLQIFIQSILLMLLFLISLIIAREDMKNLYQNQNQFLYRFTIHVLLSGFICYFLTAINIYPCWKFASIFMDLFAMKIFIILFFLIKKYTR